MEDRGHFEQFAEDLAVRRERAEAMSRSLQRHAAERFADDASDRSALSPPRPAGAGVSGPDDRLDTALLAAAVALVDATVEELGLAEHELHEQHEALLDAQLRMDERGRHYRDLFELIPAAYVVTTADGVIREINEAGARLLGRSRNFVVGKPLGMFVTAGEEQAAFRVALQRICESTRVEVWGMRLAPAMRPPVEVTVSVRTVRGGSGVPIFLYWLLGDEGGGRTDDLL